MLKYIGLLLFFSLLSYGYTDKREYAKKIRNIPSISYKQIIKQLHPLDGNASNNIRDEFLSWNENSNYTAIDFTHTLPTQILKIRENYAVVFYDFGFDKYGVVFDKNAKVRDIVLLAYRKGNNEWQVERTVTLDSPQKGIFLAKDEYRGTEWIIPQEQGEMIRLEQSLFLICVGDDGKFHIEKTSYQALYKVEDKNLNNFYRKSMKLLPKEERKALKEVQRAWLSYTTKKCSTFLKQATAPEENSVHTRSHKSECLYEETRRRTKELQSLYHYLNYYK